MGCRHRRSCSCEFVDFSKGLSQCPKALSNPVNKGRPRELSTLYAAEEVM